MSMKREHDELTVVETLMLSASLGALALMILGSIV